MSKSDRGVVTSSLVSTGSTYITAWDSMGQPSMKMAVSIGLYNPMRLWRRNAIVVFVITGLIALVLGGATLLLLRQLGARVTAERALLHRGEELIEAQRIAGIGSARFELPGLTAHLSTRLGFLLGCPTVGTEVTLDE